ncbi:MAG: RND family transporter [Deltaproteobacteria bacterium]|nr:RND family transporter [Deltaproteobacteria bacterium]
MRHLIRPIIKHPYLLPEDNPVRVAQEAMEEEFGVADMIIIGLVTDDIFNTDFLEKIKKISKVLKKIRIESDPFVDPNTGEIRTKKRRCIEDVTSLSTIDYINGTKEGMEVSDLMEEVPKNREEVSLLKERILSWDFYLGNVVSKDLKATAISIECKKALSNEELERVADEVKRTVGEAEFAENVDIYIAGGPIVAAVVTNTVMKDTARMIPIAFGVVIAVLLITMRRVSSVFMVFVTIAASVVCTMGLIVVFGFQFRMLTSAIPIILVAIGSAYSIHIINHYSDERAKGKDVVEAVENSINTVGPSVFAAALTTMAGFLSLTASGLTMIREFGLFTAIGTGVAFIVSVVFVPAALLIFDRIFGKRNKKNNPAEVRQPVDLVPFLQNLSEKMTRQSKPVFIISILLLCIAIIFTLQVTPDFYPIKMFKKGSEIRKADAMLCEKFGGTNTVAVMLEADVDDYFKEPEALRKLESLKKYMENDPEVGMVVSLTDIIKRMNYVMNENRKEYDTVPETKQHVAQYLLLHSDPEALEGMVTWDYRKARVIVLLTDGSHTTLTRINRKIHDWVNKEFKGPEVSIAGRGQMGVAFNELVLDGQIISLIFSIPTVFIIVALILKSFVGGILAIIPLSISVFLNFGILGLTGIAFDANLAIISSIAIGIGVDYAIHLLNGVKHGYMTKGPENAVREGISITGNAIIYNAASVAFGFLVLTFSSFNGLIKMGAFNAFTMVTSSVGTLLLLPVLINIIKPKFLNHNSAHHLSPLKGK